MLFLDKYMVCIFKSTDSSSMSGLTMVLIKLLQNIITSHLQITKNNNGSFLKRFCAFAAQDSEEFLWSR